LALADFLFIEGLTFIKTCPLRLAIHEFFRCYP
jgi:hypothetical protein